MSTEGKQTLTTPEESLNRPLRFKIELQRGQFPLVTLFKFRKSTISIQRYGGITKKPDTSHNNEQGTRMS